MSYLSWVNWLSNFADQAVILPLTLAIALTLWLFGWRKGAYGMIVSVLGTLVAVVATKLFFYFLTGFHALRLPIGLVSPSSHAAAGAVVYGILVALLLRGGRAGVRTAAVTSCFFALFFSLTRVELHVHTRSEVVFGSLLGVIGAITFAKIAGRMPREFNRVRLAGAAGLAILLMYGHTLHGEEPIRYVATSAQILVKEAIAAVKD